MEFYYCIIEYLIIIYTQGEETNLKDTFADRCTLNLVNGVSASFDMGSIIIRNILIPYIQEKTRKKQGEKGSWLRSKVLIHL